MTTLFISEDDIARITEIKRGKGNQSREQLQCAALRELGVPFTISRLGRPLIARSVYENITTPASNQETWVPNVLQAK